MDEVSGEASTEFPTTAFRDCAYSNGAKPFSKPNGTLLQQLAK
jgi:hypothetical protein